MSNSVLSAVASFAFIYAIGSAALELSRLHRISVAEQVVVDTTYVAPSGITQPIVPIPVPTIAPSLVVIERPTRYIQPTIRIRPPRPPRRNHHHHHHHHHNHQRRNNNRRVRDENKVVADGK
jgi:hypothetical protein